MPFSTKPVKIHMQLLVVKLKFDVANAKAESSKQQNTCQMIEHLDKVCEAVAASDKTSLNLFQTSITAVAI